MANNPDDYECGRCGGELDGGHPYAWRCDPCSIYYSPSSLGTLAGNYLGFWATLKSTRQTAPAFPPTPAVSSPSASSYSVAGHQFDVFNPYTGVWSCDGCGLNATDAVVEASWKTGNVPAILATCPRATPAMGAPAINPAPAAPLVWKTTSVDPVERIIYFDLVEGLPPTRPTCLDCGTTISSTMDAYYGRDPQEAARCSPCRSAYVKSRRSLLPEIA